MSCLCRFFVKQKTAYELRISDWSSDVCSSDLRRLGEGRELAVGHFMRVDPEAAHARLAHRAFLGIDVVLAHQEGAAGEPDRRVGDPRALALAVRRRHLRAVVGVATRRDASEDDERGKKRSEEHTSELQSLMRISYAVFCLKKKTKKHTRQNN